MKKFISIIIILAMILTLTAPDKVSAATIKISKTQATISVGESITLKLIGTTKIPKWVTSNSKIATVTSKGKITAIKKGSATISAILNKLEYTCKINVNEKTVTVTVTNMYSFDELTDYLKTIKSLKTVTNSDYTTTYTMTISQQRELIKFLRSQIDSSADLPSYYENLQINDDYTEFTVKVDSNEYNLNQDNDLTIPGLLLISIGYQQFSGVKDSELKFSITIVDKDTGKTIEHKDLSDLE